MTLQYGYGTAGAIAQGWDQIEGTMRQAHRDLSAQSSAAFPAGLRGAVDSFVSNWSGLAGESEKMAGDYARALRQSEVLYRLTEEEKRQAFEQLDNALGPGS